MKAYQFSDFLPGHVLCPECATEHLEYAMQELEENIISRLPGWEVVKAASGTKCAGCGKEIQ